MSDARERVRGRFNKQALALYSTAFFIAVVSFVGVIPRLFMLVGFKSHGEYGTDVLIISSILVVLSVFAAAVVSFQLSGFSKRAVRRQSKRRED
ncbi:MAG: hypothetical protein GWP91_23775 [Rhodobacterales bacterium]|nr:hypothetical protein [Rhodobacterales bacterium]